MINTAGNDYYGGNVLGSAAEEPGQTLARARRASLGYLYWLQTECPREDDSSGAAIGYPEFRLRPDLFGTLDGCSITPYIRESRRIRSVRPILEQEIVVRDFQGSACLGDRVRAEYMADSVGIGHYALDIHPNGHGEPNHFVATRPFQIPLGAFIPQRLTNLLPACKNLGTTHLTNGAYRLHPIEWNIGESAGLLAAYCILQDRSPAGIRADTAELRHFQRYILRQGVPLHWLVDVPQSHPAFEAVQMLACDTAACVYSGSDLNFRPEEPVTTDDWSNWSVQVHYRPHPFDGTRAEAALHLYSAADKTIGSRQ